MPARASVWTAIALAFATAPLQAQGLELIYCRQPVFRIPFQIEPTEQARLREVQLFVSEDQQAWRPYANANPDQRFFQFQAKQDGLYWFMVRTLDVEGRLFPPNLEGTKAGLRVMVDTTLPEAKLRPLPPRQDHVGLEWEVRDANLDLHTLQVEFRAQAAGEWQPLSVEAQAIGQKYWNPQVRGPLEVRLRVRDKADNQGSHQIVLPGLASVAGYDGGKAEVAGNDVPRTKAAGDLVPAGPNVKVVNTTKIVLNYSLEDVGPSGVSLVELWYTTDGRSWQRYGEDADKTSPFIMEVNGEGTYGLTLVVKSGVGIGDKPPQLGDPPQMWIEVDLQKPAVQILSAEAGRGADAGNLTITWSATDKNMASKPISLFYAKEADGPWTPIETGLENTRRYVWRIPQDAPFRFYVRVEAIDRGGNIGFAVTPKPVVVDLSQPKGRLLGVDSPVKP